MSQFSFGSGSLFGIPSGSNPTPILFGTLQEVTVDISFSLKELYGQKQFPVAIGRGPAKIDCSAKMGEFSAIAMNALFGGGTNSQGGLNVSSHTAAIPTTPFQITPSVCGGTFAEDLGVVNSATGAKFTRVASAPAAGQYSLSNGVYTFASADNVSGISVTIYYSYTTTAAGQFNAVVSNSDMGSATPFTVILSNPYQGKNLVLKLYSCISSKLALPFKNTDFSIPQFDFQALANSAGQVYQLTLTDQ